jgi:hypothetical protein
LYKKLNGKTTQACKQLASVIEQDVQVLLPDDGSIRAETYSKTNKV